MIKLTRASNSPAALNEEGTGPHLDEIRRCIEAGERPTFKKLWLNQNVRRQIWRAQHQKCCYCEKVRELMRESDVDHFRPKGSVKSDDTHPGYWWLVYNWENLLYSCKPCNETYKMDNFPLLEGGVRSVDPQGPLEQERAILIDPYRCDPGKLISYDWQHSDNRYVKAVGLDDERRGETTIKLIGLNRTDLMEERAQVILTLDAIVTTIKAGIHFGKRMVLEEGKRRLKAEVSSERPFLGFRRAFFRSAQMAEYMR